MSVWSVLTKSTSYCIGFCTIIHFFVLYKHYPVNFVLLLHRHSSSSVETVWVSLGVLKPQSWSRAEVAEFGSVYGAMATRISRGTMGCTVLSSGASGW